MVFKKNNIPWNVGIKTPDNVKLKIKENSKINPNYGMKGKHFSEESKLQNSLSHLGKHHTEESKNKMSEYRKGREHSSEWNKKVAFALTGKKKSKEHCDSIRKSKAHLLGKTYEEIFGEEKTKKIKEQLSKKLSLQNNPRWKGGKSFEPYTTDFNIKLKNLIRKRDNQVCMLCGVHREQLSKALDIHHINYDKQLSIPENCIALCNSCHSRTSENRESWMIFFQSLLHARYSYNYSLNKEAIINIEEMIK